MMDRRIEHGVVPLALIPLKSNLRVLSLHFVEVEDLVLECLRQKQRLL